MGAARRLRVDEGGYTLPELLMGVVIGLLVASGAAMVLMMSVRAQPHTTERAGQIQQGRVMLETLTRELRQGESIVSASPSQLELLTYVSTGACGVASSGTARLCQVAYSCGSSACTRTERPPGITTGGSTRTVVSGITGPNVFSPSGDDPLDPTYVGVRLVFPQDSGEEAVTIDDGAALRNHFDASGDL